MKYNSEMSINDRVISFTNPAYFIADIASNHNGDLSTAKELIWKAKESGADAVKFQHFLAEKIVSDYGFRQMGGQSSHQKLWKKSVYDTYKEAEFNRSWNEILAEEAKKAKIDFMTSPYDYNAVEEIDKLVPAYKIGSGDITWIDFISFIAKKRKPVFLATGASNMEDVERAVNTILMDNPDIVLMQCNTNYTGSLENFKFINLNVLKTFAIRFPGMVLGLSDHTKGHSTVLGAISLGARVIEKHFTLDNNQEGPDHAFSMNPESWREMIDRSRELEASFGTGIKIVEGNEKETVVLQRRCLRLKESANKGTVLRREMLEELRPAPVDSIFPYEVDNILGKELKLDKQKGDYIRLEDLN